MEIFLFIKLLVYMTCNQIPCILCSKQLIYLFTQKKIMNLDIMGYYYIILLNIRGIVD